MSGIDLVSGGGVAQTPKGFGFFPHGMQNTNIANGDHVALSNQIGNTILCDETAYPNSGRIQLLQGKSYHLYGAIQPRFSSTTNYLYLSWYDITNASTRGIPGEVQNYPSLFCPDLIAQAFIVNLPSNIIVELRFINQTNLNEVQPRNGIWIKEL